MKAIASSFYSSFLPPWASPVHGTLSCSTLCLYNSQWFHPMSVIFRGLVYFFVATSRQCLLDSVCMYFIFFVFVKSSDYILSIGNCRRLQLMAKAYHCNLLPGDSQKKIDYWLVKSDIKGGLCGSERRPIS